MTDLDDTLVLPLEYWGYLIKNNKDFFEDPIWDEWKKIKSYTVASTFFFLILLMVIGSQLFLVIQSHLRVKKTQSFLTLNGQSLWLKSSSE
ncbi:TPA: hypothetical protein RQJ54_000994 [Vibrio vulnificus]|uniref:Uncharacterized protein n=1 Tax=Vibrio vulnificus TaxID=672 RepID=A0AAW4H7A4_VIBVL|nr:hypothetical protein [Vibrio vulnificus]MBE3697019.1 hypothetical protein [Vibrio parahaemolyticus]MBE3777028.1 hypothetical protein [Vibrio parahaemolyticus]MBE4418168.1 hypothetical protein [Vibrio parahaemolyticus]MBE4468324.1 hypothetical protein [Vibrio parahaemolyticus]